MKQRLIKKIERMFSKNSDKLICQGRLICVHYYLVMEMSVSLVNFSLKLYFPALRLKGLPLSLLFPKVLLPQF